MVQQETQLNISKKPSEHNNDYNIKNLNLNINYNIIYIKPYKKLKMFKKLFLITTIISSVVFGYKPTDTITGEDFK